MDSVLSSMDGKSHIFVKNEVRTKREALEEIERLKKQFMDIAVSNGNYIQALKEKHGSEIMGYQVKINCMGAAHTEEIERLKSEYSAAGKISELAFEIIHEIRRVEKV
jgi:predicted small secreted protein